MKTPKLHKILRPTVIGLAVAPILTGVAFAAAGDEVSQGRKIWDLVWLFINFGILLFFLIKFGRKPIMDYLSGHSEGIKETLGAAETALEEAEAEFEQTRKKLDDIGVRISELEDLRKREAERARNRILGEAEATSALILSEAREKADSEVREAMLKVKAELVDLALSEAEEKIRELITTDDQDRIITENIGQLNSEIK